MRILLSIIFFLLPLQSVTTIPIGNTSVDLSIFLLYLVVLQFKRFYSYALLSFIFLFIHALMIIQVNKDFNPSSFLASSTTITLCLAALFYKLKDINKEIIITNIFKGIKVSSNVFLTTFFLWLIINPTTIRLQLLFSEPSYCSLYAIGLAIFWLNNLIYKSSIKNKIFEIFLVIIYILIAYYTKSSSTFVLFFIGIFISLFISLKLKTGKNEVFKFSIPRRIIYLIFLPVSLFIIFFRSLILRNFWKLNLGNIDNLSALSHYLGFIQLKLSLAKSFLFGVGLGQTGNWLGDTSRILNYVNSENINFSSSFYYVNIYDTYSLLYRLGVELGVFGIFIAIYILINTLLNLNNLINQVSKEKLSIYAPSITFLIILFLGCLLKLPVYTYNIVIIPFFFLSLFTNPPRLKNLIKYLK